MQRRRRRRAFRHLGLGPMLGLGVQARGIHLCRFTRLSNIGNLTHHAHYYIVEQILLNKSGGRKTHDAGGIKNFIIPRGGIMVFMP